MDKVVDIHKAAGILIRDRKFLISRSKGKDFFISPGGKLQSGETSEEALARELLEELTITISTDTLETFGTFYAQATGDDDKYLQMDVFVVNDWQGTIQPDNEIEELRWVDSRLPEQVQLGSIFRHEVLPRLKERGLID